MDADDNTYSFRGFEHSCSASYKFVDGKYSKTKSLILQNNLIIDELRTQDSCALITEFDGVNHKTSHDGLFKVKIEMVNEEALAQIGGIRVTVGGEYTLKKGKDNDDLVYN